MSLAQVVYNISRDSEFADLWRKDPEAALARKGLKLSREELAFLSAGLKRGMNGGHKVPLSELALRATSWRQ